MTKSTLKVLVIAAVVPGVWLSAAVAADPERGARRTSTLRAETRPRLRAGMAAAQSAITPPIVKQFEETSYYLKDLAMIDANTGWAVGAPHWDQVVRQYKGTILKTTNGGGTWNAQEAASTETFRGVHFVDANQGWVVGTNGTILHTGDGGAHWAKQQVASVDEFRGVAFTDANNGWVAGMRPVHYSDFMEDFDDWQGSIWHTSDGGRSWTQQPVPSSASILNRIDFVDSQTGWAVGIKLKGYDYGDEPQHVAAVYHTTDGGRTWAEQYSPELAMVFTAVDFVDANTGWVGGFLSNSGIEGGSMYHTIDGGKTWQRQSPGEFNNNIWDIQFVDRNRGYAVGTMYGAAWGPPVWRTTDGGATWTMIIQDKNDGEGLYGVAVAGSQVIAVGDNDLFAKSTTPWEPGATPFSCFNNGCLFTQKYLNTHYIFHDVFFTDDNHGCAVGSKTFDVSLWGQVVLCTEDAGTTWNNRYEHAPPLDGLFSYHRLDRVWFADRLNGWAVGAGEYDSGRKSRGGIVRTSDGGQHWAEQGAELYSSWDIEFSAVQFLNGSEGWALADGRVPYQTVFLAHTSDGGAHWTWVDTGVDASIAVGFLLVQGGMAFADAQHGVIAGWDAALRTEDGGAHWTKATVSCGNPVCYLDGNAVAFSGGNRTGWIVGSDLYKTVDGGANWTPLNFKPTGFGLQDIQFIDSRSGWLVGDSGTLMNTTDGGDHWSSVASGTSAMLRGVSFPNAQHGWIVGEYGTILSYAGDRAPAGKPAIFGVVNSASFLPGIASAAWISVFGANLAPATRMWSLADFNGNKLPTALDGVSVNINGKPAYTYYNSPGQLNVLGPADSAEGPVSVEVVTAQGRSEVFTAQKGAYSPGLFRFAAEGGRYVVAQGLDGKWIGYFGLMYALNLTGQMRDAQPGEIITFYGSGFGLTDPAVATDSIVGQPAVLTAPVTFRFGRTTAEVIWAGLIGSGLYQFNIRVPSGAPDGGNVVVAEIGGYRSQGDSLISVRGR